MHVYLFPYSRHAYGKVYHYLLFQRVLFSVLPLVDIKVNRMTAAYRKEEKDGQKTAHNEDTTDDIMQINSHQSHVLVP